MDISGKVWGTTQHIFSSSNVEIHRITIDYMGFCSKHLHNHKCNIFYVESGKIKIKVWKKAYALCDETILSAGQKMTVPPGEFHMFEALQDSVAYEIYYMKPICSGDIEREMCGGKPAQPTKMPN